MKRSVLFLVMFSAMLLAVTSAVMADELFPAPSITGATGIVRMPTADVLPYRNMNIGFDYGVNSITNKSELFYKMNLGTFQGLELGITGGTSSTGEALREGVFINMKYSLAAGSYDNPLLLAIGVENLSSYHQTDVYMVATRYLNGPKIHFGFMGDFPGDKFRPLGMFGLEFPMFSSFLFSTDMLAGETIFQLDTGLRWYLSPTLAMNISGLNVTYSKDNPQAYKDPQSWLIGFSWTNPF